MRSAPFKQYERQQRVQQIETTYKSGMKYTDAPLVEGFNKAIVNMDIDSDGASLTPRKGLKLLRSLPIEKLFSKTVKGITYAHPYFFIGGKENVLEQGEAGYYVLGGFDENNVPDLRIYSENTDAVEGISFRTSDVKFIFPEDGTIHDLQINQQGYSRARHVGCFAWNDGYYCFNTATKQLQQTYLNEETNLFEFRPVEAYQPNATESSTWGYNMLLEKPYSFVNDFIQGTPDNFLVQGITVCDSNEDGSIIDDEPIMTQLLNKRYWYALRYAAGEGTYKIKWEVKEAGTDDWQQIGDELEVTIAEDNVADITVPYTSNYKNAVIVVTVTVGETVKLNRVGYQFGFDSKDRGIVNTLKPVKYDLSTCRGMVYWRRRLVVGAVEQDNTVLFMSEPDNPAYFPYGGTSGMLDYFDEPIMNMVPFLDDLLVFTSSKLYRITLNEDGITFTKVCLQENLYITEYESQFTKVIKNMLFFKSGNYYYMVVPRTGTTELTIAPIYKSIEGFLNNFRESVDTILNELYNCPMGAPFIYAYNFLDYEDIHNVYVFQAPYNYTVEGELFPYYIHLHLLYNSVSRTWRIYIQESRGLMANYRQDATKKGIQVSVIASEGILNFYAYAQEYDCIDSESVHFPNWQMLDTGYREHSTENKKRYRELQFRVNNTAQETLHFGVSFYIDGELRRGNYIYTPEYIYDDETKKSCTITLVQKLVVDARLTVPGVTTLNPEYSENAEGEIVKESSPMRRADYMQDGQLFLDYESTKVPLPKGEDPENLRGWILDQSLFPTVAYWKMRVPISGKGYAPRIVLTSRNQSFFELLGCVWVLRMMNSR